MAIVYKNKKKLKKDYSIFQNSWFIKVLSPRKGKEIVMKWCRAGLVLEKDTISSNLRSRSELKTVNTGKIGAESSRKWKIERMGRETHRSEEEHEAGEDEATTNKTDLKWIHDDDDDDEDDGEDDFEDDEDEVWLRRRAFIYLLQVTVLLWIKSINF